MKPTLLVMAAGRGSRYGGDKQVEGVGPSGESLLEYGVFDAKRAGFGRIVLVIRDELVPAFDALRARLPPDLEVAYAVQRQDDVPERFEAPAKRTKPWGTTHAVLAARGAITTPFAVVNADDFYGTEAYTLAAEACHAAQASGDYAIIGLRLDRTLSDHGAVVRGIPAVKDGYLTWLDEVREVGKQGGRIIGLALGVEKTFTGAEIASMNCWVFTPKIFEDLARLFDKFLKTQGQDLKSESPLPEAINELVQEGRARVRVLEAPGPWFGMTYKEDLEKVRQGLRTLVDQGAYPESLVS